MKGQLALFDPANSLPVLNRTCTAALGRTGWEPLKGPKKKVKVQ